MTRSLQAEKSKIPFAALILGYAGLIPFILPALWLWTQEPTMFLTLEAIKAQQTYAAIILSFMGAVHWGFETAEHPTSPRLNALMASVSPALFGWMCLLMDSSRWSFLLLALAFIVLLGFDFAQKRASNAMPSWYLKLRVPLTLVAVGSLLASAFA